MCKFKLTKQFGVPFVYPQISMNFPVRIMAWELQLIILYKSSKELAYEKWRIQK